MPDNPQPPKKSITPDWLVQGALTKIGDTFDRLTGRRWRPSSSLATSGLVERMKSLLDAEAKTDEEGRKFVPHNITLKMQWDKFSTDSEDGLRKLENELLTAAVDHISDQRYYTHAPLNLQVKPDYFTQGVKLFVSFDKEEHEAELNVTVPAAQLGHLIPPEFSTTPSAEAASTPPVQEGSLLVRYEIEGRPGEKRFDLKQGRRLSIGRTKQNDIALDHTSVSKMHASLLLNSEGKLVVADTGSTNGTYLNGERIAYGKAIEIFESDKLKFGAIDVELEFKLTQSVSPDAPTEAYTAGDLQFTKKTEVVKPAVTSEEVTPDTIYEPPVAEDDSPR
jgi:pSer/pThr/pTyr-binding forkhead associated (FHA) protein